MQAPSEIEPIQPLELTTRLFSAPELQNLPAADPPSAGFEPED